MKVFVFDGNLNDAIKRLKKGVQKEGIMRDFKNHTHYTKPSEQRRLDQRKAVRRAERRAKQAAKAEMPTFK